MSERPPVIVHPPSLTGGRRVTVGAEVLGVAYGPADLLEFLRRAGLDVDAVSLDDRSLIEWRGGGPDAWTRPRLSRGHGTRASPIALSPFGMPSPKAGNASPGAWERCRP